MLNKLFKLHGQLTRAAGEAWLAETDYRIEHAGTADFDATLYGELNRRTDILIDACEEVMTAIKVINSVGDTSNSDKIRHLIEMRLKDATHELKEAGKIVDGAYARCGEFTEDFHDFEREAAEMQIFHSGQVTAYKHVLKILEDA